MERLRIRRLLDGLVSDIIMKHLQGLVSGVLAHGYIGLTALENVREQLPLILDALNKLPTNEQKDKVMDSQQVLGFFMKLVTVSGDREIQFFALSILLSTPFVLKFGVWMADHWFPIEPIRIKFLTLLQMPQEKKVYHDFLNLLNVGDGARVYSWECHSVVREDSSSDSVKNGKTLLSINLGTRTISHSLLGRDIRLPFSDIENHEVKEINIEGHEMLQLRIETTDKCSYSFLGLKDEIGGSMFLSRGHLSQLLENENSTSHGNGEEEIFDLKLFQKEMSTLKEVTLKHGDPELIYHEPKRGIGHRVVKLQHENPEHINHKPKRGIGHRVVKLQHENPEHIKHKPKCRIIRGVSTQSNTNKVYTKKTSRGLNVIEGGSSGNRTTRTATKRLRRTTLKKSRMSAQQAVARVSKQ